MEYEWDENKRTANLQKHKLDFSKAYTVLENPESISVDDAMHSLFEKRIFTIGYFNDELCVVVIHTRRFAKTRIISFRPANRKEKELYYGNG